MPGGRNQCSPHPYIYPTTEKMMHYSGCARLKTALPVFSCWKQQSLHCETVLCDSLSSLFFACLLNSVASWLFSSFVYHSCGVYVFKVYTPDVFFVTFGFIYVTIMTYSLVLICADIGYFFTFILTRTIATQKATFLFSAPSALTVWFFFSLFSLIPCWCEQSLRRRKRNIFMFPEPVVSRFSVPVHGWLWKLWTAHLFELQWHCFTQDIMCYRMYSCRRYR